MTRFRIGPGILVTAAFIGPGTLTVCSMAGARFDLQLLWALLLSVLLTAFLQILVARLSWESGQGLVEMVREQSQGRWIQPLLLGAISLAIFVGNAAYEAGNLTGALLGIEVLLPRSLTTASYYAPLVLVAIGAVSAFFLWQGNPRWIKNLLMGGVLLMSVSFLVTAFWVGPAGKELLQGLFVPSLPRASLLTVMALIGTTIVPYNLFLHAALSKNRQQYASVSDLRNDSLLAIGLGGLISICIVIASAAAGTQQLRSAVDLAEALVPLYGQGAQYLVGLGLFAAGLSSALTAPLAAAFVIQESMGWPQQSQKSKAVALSVLGFGLAALGWDATPTGLIQFAQVANALLLPFMVLFLAYLVRKIQARFSIQLGLAVIFVVFVALSAKTLWGLIVKGSLLTG